MCDFTDSGSTVLGRMPVHVNRHGVPVHVNRHGVPVIRHRLPQLRGKWCPESLWKGKISWRHPSGAQVRLRALLPPEQLAPALKEALNKFKKTPEWSEILKSRNCARASLNRAAIREKKAKAKKVEEARVQAARLLMQESKKNRREFDEKLKEHRANFEELRKRPEAKPDGHDPFENLRSSTGGTQRSLIGSRFPISGRSNDNFA